MGRKVIIMYTNYLTAVSSNRKVYLSDYFVNVFMSLTSTFSSARDVLVEALHLDYCEEDEITSELDALSKEEKDKLFQNYVFDYVKEDTDFVAPAFESELDETCYHSLYGTLFDDYVKKVYDFYGLLD